MTNESDFNYAVLSQSTQKHIFKYAYDVVDGWSLDDLREYAERKLIEEAEIRMKDDPKEMLYEMCDFWNVQSLSEINPDDFKA